MSTPLDPIISEFDTQEQADSYDRWFRERVQRSLDDPRPNIPHDEAMARVRAVIEARKPRHASG
ncbi:stability determinant [Modicisalibacter tunisiensis]|uniref:Stability determinant n=1 Tax=Modicisalibacter tunisiensis TaxID=390637 RepID=A0ABS7X2Z0_9GAMM|nr:stability determinant [Modicisalibacter tunisiensis]MBZ9540524.1 stability determinant [Modicisalibacter tunisiensis]MBZ9569255.1 stability determinant [Modicisalibacter tunisiensis]